MARSHVRETPEAGGFEVLATALLLMLLLAALLP
jgi:UDP-N-acetylmuramyl pentapeptide phosphotransferase/UDP-N-acetylglucosamine-1-phosphate transferase